MGRRAYICAQVALNGALQALNIISVILSAQVRRLRPAVGCTRTCVMKVMDNALTALFGQSCALNLTPFANLANGTVVDGSTLAWSCMDTISPAAGSAWGCHVVISGGFLLAAAFALPMGYFNLDQNMIVQV